MLQVATRSSLKLPDYVIDNLPNKVVIQPGCSLVDLLAINRLTTDNFGPTSNNTI